MFLHIKIDPHLHHLQSAEGKAFGILLQIDLGHGRFRRPTQLQFNDIQLTGNTHHHIHTPLGGTHLHIDIHPEQGEDDVEQLLSKVIDSLPERCREIFLKSKIEGKKQKEIAEEMNISINTVETQMGIAYKKLRNELKDYFPLFIFLYYL